MASRSRQRPHMIGDPTGAAQARGPLHESMQGKPSAANLVLIGATVLMLAQIGRIATKKV